MREIPSHLPCFGRAVDLERLAERVGQRGVTFVMAPPRMGKTWLVRNLAFEWARREGWNIGYAQSSGGKNDLLREVVADLYQRWLGGANFVAQARSLWERHKDGLVGKVGGAVGKLLGKIAALADGDWSGASKLIDETFDSLTRAEQDLRSGGLTLAPITYEDARDLVGTVGTVTGKPILLVMDAWERGLDLTGDRGSIRRLLDNEDEWPGAFHLLVVIRDLPKHLEEVRFAGECCDTHPSAGRFAVEQLDLSSLEEQDRLLLFLRERAPAVADAERDWVVEQCANPAVIEWWIRRQPSDQKALAAEAANARDKQYMGLFDLIEQVQERAPLFDATVRLAMLPEITSAAMWQAYRELIDADDADGLVADLQSRRVLDPNQYDYPSFGHTTAYDAVHDFLLRAPANRSQPDPRPRVRALLKELIRDLAGRIRSVTPDASPFTAALARTTDTIGAAGLGGVWEWPGRLALAMFGNRLNTDERGNLVASSRELDSELPMTRALLAMVLFNSLLDAKEERDFPQRDGMLNGLRQLVQSHPGDAGVRVRLAKGLVNTHCDAKEEQNLPRRDGLLNELRQLSQAHPADTAVRERLAMGLFNTLCQAKDEQELRRRDALLSELRQLSEAHSDDAAVRARLAMGLFNTLNYAEDEHDPAGRDRLLSELRQLEEAHPGDGAVRENLAKGLVNTLAYEKAEQDVARRDGLLSEVRQLAVAHPEDAAVREQFALGLFNTLGQATEEQELPRRTATLSELRQLAEAYPEDGGVGRVLAMGLGLSWKWLGEEGDTAERAALLVELRELLERHADDERLAEARAWLDEQTGD